MLVFRPWGGKVKREAEAVDAEAKCLLIANREIIQRAARCFNTLMYPRGRKLDARFGRLEPGYNRR